VRKATHWYENRAGAVEPPPPSGIDQADLDCGTPVVKRAIAEGRLRAMGFTSTTPVPIICLVAGDAENMRAFNAI
jgi:hypothetical protein